MDQSATDSIMQDIEFYARLEHFANRMAELMGANENKAADVWEVQLFHFRALRDSFVRSAGKMGINTHSIQLSVDNGQEDGQADFDVFRVASQMKYPRL